VLAVAYSRTVIGGYYPAAHLADIIHQLRLLSYFDIIARIYK